MVSVCLTQALIARPFMLRPQLTDHATVPSSLDASLGPACTEVQAGPRSGGDAFVLAPVAADLHKPMQVSTQRRAA